MRQWMCDTRILCQPHLLGEHNEHHMFNGTLKRGKKVDGYILNNLLEPKAIYSRHEELSKEMLNRGMKHNSPLNEDECKKNIRYLSKRYREFQIDRGLSLISLLDRCDECLNNFCNLYIQSLIYIEQTEYISYINGLILRWITYDFENRQYLIQPLTSQDIIYWRKKWTKMTSIESFNFATTLANL